MKTFKFNTLITKLFLGLFTLLFLFSFEVSAKKVKFQTSTVVPAARGYAKVTRDKNRNYEIKIQIRDLAEVTRLSPSKLTYIVWMVTDEEITKNMGQINSTTSLFSKKLKASFETVSSFTPAKLFITAEDDPSRQYPGTQVVISTDRF